MDSISVNQFRDNLKSCVETIANTHSPLKVTRRNGRLCGDECRRLGARARDTLYPAKQ